MKKANLLIFLTFLLLIFAACRPQPLFIEVNGDIEGVSVQVPLRAESYMLSDILSTAKTPAGGRVMITAADGTSALIERDTADKVSIERTERDTFNAVAPEHPRVVGIKDIADITYIADGGDGFRILHPDRTEVYSHGASKLLFFEQEGGEQRMQGNLALKFVPQYAVAVTDGYIYFDDQSIMRGDNTQLHWKSGRVMHGGKPVFGIAYGADKVIFDAYFAMRDALDQNIPVIAILIDGLLLAQLQYFTLTSNPHLVALSVYPPISNVALASIITGADPATTGTLVRGIRKPNVPDIFDYALAKGKTAAYIEGHSRLLITNIEQTFSTPDTGRATDKPVFDNAMKARAGSPDLLFVHFHGVDDINHDFGVHSAEAIAKIAEIQEYIRLLLEGFSGRVVLVSDHGHLEAGGHGEFTHEELFTPYWVFTQ
jgi:hypothetical protein